MKDKYHYTESGLDNVYLVNGFKYEETPFGRGVHIENVNGLHRAIGKDIIEIGRPLAGNEIKFLRESMDCSQKELAELLGFGDAQPLLHAERGDRPLRAAVEATLRELYRQHIHEGSPLELLKLLKQLQNKEPLPVENFDFEEVEHNWRTPIVA